MGEEVGAFQREFRYKVKPPRGWWDRVACLGCAVVALCAVSARADLGFVVMQPAQSGVGSNEVAFAGTLTNSNALCNLFLNDVQFSFDGAASNYLSGDSNSFFGNVPGILLPGENYCGMAFGIAVNAATPPGNYTGAVTLVGGTNIFASSNLASQSFQISLLPSALDITACGSNVVVTWLSPPSGFVLQQNSDLTTTNWQTVTNAASFFNGSNWTGIQPSASGLFFRLAYP